VDELNAQDKMPHYADCYVFVAERSPQLVRRLIETFLPGGAVQVREIFEIPQYSEQPTHVFNSASELAAFMESHPEETQCVYWHSATAGDYTQANVHFIVGGMVLGIGIPAGNNEDEDAILDQLKREFATEHGFIDYEQPPPASAKEFLDAAKQCSEQGVPPNA
jgi:hypothetical protein